MTPGWSARSGWRDGWARAVWAGVLGLAPGRAQGRGQTHDGSRAYSLAVSVEGRTLAIGGIDGNIQICDTSSGRITTTLGHEAVVTGAGMVYSMSFSPDVEPWPPPYTPRRGKEVSSCGRSNERQALVRLLGPAAPASAAPKTVAVDRPWSGPADAGRVPVGTAPDWSLLSRPRRPAAVPVGWIITNQTKRRLTRASATCV